MRNIDKRNNVVCDVAGNKKFRVDGCIRKMIHQLNLRGVDTVGSCAGHLRYPPSIVYKTMTNEYYELFSGVRIMRKKRFYLKDKDGFYYIPEALDVLGIVSGEGLNDKKTNTTRNI